MSDGGICSITSTAPDSSAALRAAGLPRNFSVTVSNSGFVAPVVRVRLHHHAVAGDRLLEAIRPGADHRAAGSEILGGDRRHRASPAR